MQDVMTISRHKPADAAFDYEELRKIGIQYLEKTASSLWTDFNIHDPGITSLELLCYAITDLSYRTMYSVPDLLATESNTVESIKKHFFSAKQIFPNKAVTINDYRKLIVDIPGIKNAWLNKRTKEIYADLINKTLSLDVPKSRKWEPVLVKGYYDILVEFDTNIRDAGKGGLKKRVREAVMLNRNLCEDFLNVDEVTTQEFRLCAEFDIKPGASPFDTLARIFFNIQLHLTPLIRFYSLKQMFDANYSSDTIFEGPLLENGFIKEEELVNSSLKTEIHLSDIMREILKEDGVINIQEIIFNPTAQVTALPNKWIIDVADGKQPVINILESNVVMYKEGNPFRPNMSEVKARFEKLMADYINKNELTETEDITYDTGSYQNVESYYSIQNDYPKNYGISHWGLPEDAPDERKAQAKQLQGYLYFFDQHLANYLSQLAHIRHLFSMEKEQQTYFTRLVDDFKDASDLFVNYNASATSLSASAGRIQSAAEVKGSKPFYKRRNLFLDHLLSRFAESFFDYVNILQTIDPSINEEEIINTKINFLQDYPSYSLNRFNAYNYTDNGQLWDTNNTSGLEKRLQRLLGFEDIKRKTLVNIYMNIRDARNAVNIDEFWFEIVDNRANKVLLKANQKSPSLETAKNHLNNALEFAGNAISFTLVEDQADHTFTYVLKKADNTVLGLSDAAYPSRQLAQNDITKLISLLLTDQSEEGMFVVEHLMLLPERKEVPSIQSPPLSPPLSPPQSPVQPPAAKSFFMPICVDENCDDCELTDPYSFRISVILPAYAPRFLNMEFRRYCERIIRMETPSHIYPKICWVNNEDLYRFENAYKSWLEVKGGLRDDIDNQLLAEFISILTTIKSIYPPARLEDCKNTEEKKLFLLNQNALGTLKT